MGETLCSPTSHYAMLLVLPLSANYMRQRVYACLTRYMNEQHVVPLAAYTVVLHSH